MGLHAEVPLIALLGLVHVGIARLVGVLGRGRRVDDRRIDDGALGNLDPARLEMAVNLLEHPSAQIVLLEQMAETAHRRLVGHRLAAQVDADEAPHRKRVIQRLLDRRIRQVEPVLDKVDAQHPLQADRRATVPGFRIDRLDQPTQAAPRHHSLHLRQKRRPPRRLAVTLEPRRRQCHLLHRTNPGLHFAGFSRIMDQRSRR